MRRPALACNERENGADGGWLDHRREGLSEINLGVLIKPTNDPSSLVVLESAVGIQFMLEHPLPSDQRAPGGRGMRDQVWLA